MKDQAHFGIVVACLREALGYSQGEFATALEVSQSSISRWESGDSVPSVLEWERAKRLPLAARKLKRHPRGAQ